MEIFMDVGAIFHEVFGPVVMIGALFVGCKLIPDLDELYEEAGEELAAFIEGEL